MAVVAPDSQTGPRVVLAYLSCIVTVIGLLFRRQLPLNDEHVGRHLSFADGTRSRIYRETVRRGVSTLDPVLLIVRFELRLIGHSRVLHAVFRVESLANTLLFAGFPGFARSCG